MDKKLVTMVTSLALGGTLLFGSAYVNAAQVSGYDAYKNALKNTVNLKNETANVQLSLQDNGTNLVDVNSNVKVNLASQAMSSVTSVKSGSDVKTFANYLQDGKSITKGSDSDQYVLRENRHKELNKINQTENSTAEKSIEVIIDTLVGSMQNKVAVIENTDGTKTINIDLNENEVTPLVNAVASLAFAKEDHHGFRPERSDKADGLDPAEKAGKAHHADLENVIPKLQGDVKVKIITSKIDVNKDDVITGQTAKIVVSGQDAQGKQHELTLNVNLGLSNINSTTPDKVDLTGKNVKTASFEKRGER